MRLQRCEECGQAQYPAREFCGACLSDRMDWESTEFVPARVLACTVLHHSNEAAFRARLPMRVGLVRFEAGPVAVCFLRDGMAAGDLVRVAIGVDGLLQAHTVTAIPDTVIPGPDPGELVTREGDGRVKPGHDGSI